MWRHNFKENSRNKIIYIWIHLILNFKIRLTYYLNGYRTGKAYGILERIESIIETGILNWRTKNEKEIKRNTVIGDFEEKRAEISFRNHFTHFKQIIIYS